MRPSLCISVFVFSWKVGRDLLIIHRFKLTQSTNDTQMKTEYPNVQLTRFHVSQVNWEGAFLLLPFIFLGEKAFRLEQIKPWIIFDSHDGMFI